MKKMWTDENVKTITIIKLSFLLILVVSGIAALFGTFCEIMGFLNSDSVWELIFFGLITTFISFPISRVIEMLPMHLYVNYRNVSLKEARVIFIILDTIAMLIGQGIIDFIMQGIDTTFIVDLPLAFLFALLYKNDIE